jgi:hypothetical protein
MLAFMAVTPFDAYAETVTPSGKLAFVAPPAVADPNIFALPYAAPAYDLGKFDIEKFRKRPTPPSFDTVDLGKSVLRVDVVDGVVTRPDTPDLTDVIVPARPGKKRSTPRYFGFTLSTPTH